MAEAVYGTDRSAGDTSKYETTRRTQPKAAGKESLGKDDYFERVSFWHYFVVILGFVIFEVGRLYVYHLFM